MSEPYWIPLASAPISALPIVTSLPGAPVNGQRVILVDSLTAPTYAWEVQFVEAKATNKWIFVGGSPAYSEVLANEGTTSTTYASLTTPGPSIVIPVAGEYIIQHGFTATGAKPNYMSYDIGATAAVDADSIRTAIDGVIDGSGTVSRLRRKSVGAGSIVAKYRGYGGQNTGFMNRWLAITPVAIGG